MRGSELFILKPRSRSRLFQNVGVVYIKSAESELESRKKFFNSAALLARHGRMVTRIATGWHNRFRLKLSTNGSGKSVVCISLLRNVFGEGQSDWMRK